MGGAQRKMLASSSHFKEETSVHMDLNNTKNQYPRLEPYLEAFFNKIKMCLLVYRMAIFQIEFESDLERKGSCHDLTLVVNHFVEKQLGLHIEM